MAEVPQSAEWYVRSAIIKALIVNQSNVEAIRAALADKTLAGTWASSYENIMAYELQWRREAWAEFEKLPDGLRPNLDMMVRDI